MAEDPGSGDLRTLLLYGEVYDFATSPDQKGKPKGEIAKALLSPSFLSIMKEKDVDSPELEKAFSHAIDVCRKRLPRLIDKVQRKKLFHDNPSARNEVFFDLNDEQFSALISDPNEGNQFSQFSNFSDRPSSQRSELEIEVPSEIVVEVMDVDPAPAQAGDAPVSKKRKYYDSWDTLTPAGKRKRTKDVYELMTQVANDSGIEPYELAAYLGKRSCYQKDGLRDVANYFDKILK